jgi:hypothetical protein
MREQLSLPLVEPQPRHAYAGWIGLGQAYLRDECGAHKGVAFFLKQMSKKASIPDDLLVRQFPIPDRSRIGTAAKHARKAAS